MNPWPIANSKLMHGLLYLPLRAYDLAAYGRHKMYQAGYWKANAVRTPVISIGNLTVGGTGKTPMVEFLARFLTEEGLKVTILTRGYKRRSKAPRVIVSDRRQVQATVEDAGDEPALLAKSLPGVAVIVGPNRYENARWAEEHLPTDVFLLDDGFQHMQFSRDLNLLLLDAADPFGGGELVPIGRLREPLATMSRADAIVVTRVDHITDRDLLVAKIRHRLNAIPILFTRHRITSFREMRTGESILPDEFAGQRIAVFCGLAQPESFFADLLNLRLEIVWRKAYPDHHFYGADDLVQIGSNARRAGADAIITTEKDLVKVERLTGNTLPLYSALLKIETEEETAFKALVLSAISAKTNSLKE